MTAPHPRTLIRHAVVAVLHEAPALAALCCGRIYPNRESPWMEDELPAIGVYMLAEEPLETDVSPPWDERRLTLAVEIIAQMNDGLDDALDTLALALEQALGLDAIGEKLRENDTLLELQYSGAVTEIVENGKRLVGLATLNFTIDYTMHVPSFADLPAYLQSYTGWDIKDSDPRVIDAEDAVAMPGWNEETMA